MLLNTDTICVCFGKIYSSFFSLQKERKENLKFKIFFQLKFHILIIFLRFYHHQHHPESILLLSSWTSEEEFIIIIISKQSYFSFCWQLEVEIFCRYSISIPSTTTTKTKRKFSHYIILDFSNIGEKWRQNPLEFLKYSAPIIYSVAAAAAS